MNFDEKDFYQNDYGFGGNNIGQKSDCCYKTIEKSCYCCPVKWDENKNCNDKKDEKHHDKECNCECRCKCDEKKEEKNCGCEEKHNKCDNHNNNFEDRKDNSRCCNRCCFFRGFRF